MGVFDVDNSKLMIKDCFEYEVEVIENLRIPVNNEYSLAAKLWLPKNTDKVKGTILEYLPYRKDDFTALRDSIRHPYFAGHGYACLRVDIRGSGDSDGIMDDEYSPTEQSDCLAVFDWVTQQSWSQGNIAMIGKSWGGFNGLQMAALNHPALKTVISLYSTDDRYADDVHYKGGTLMGSDMLWWASTMLAYNARPPLPRYHPNWKQAWADRIENTPALVETWVTHQYRDAYWEHGSVCENYNDIKIPIFVLGGWADGYTNAVFRLMDNLTVPKRGIIGPWTHEFPDVATPAPRIGYLQECLDWFGKFLDVSPTPSQAHHKDEFLIYLQDSVEPSTHYDYRHGQWIDLWNSKTVTIDLFANLENTVSLQNHLHHGLYSGVFCPFGQIGDLPADQRIDNALATSLLYTELQEDLHIAGRIRANLKLKSDQVQANIHLRISDVHPNGKKTLITHGPFNLCHHSGHANPSYLTPGEWFDCSFLLDGIAYTIPKGHFIEISCSPSYWPQIWPSPSVANITIDLQQSKLLIPTLTTLCITELPYPHSETAFPIEKTTIREGFRTRHIVNQLENNQWILNDFSDEGERTLAHNQVTHGSTNQNIYTIIENDPLSATVECSWTVNLSDKDMNTQLNTISKMFADKDYFYLENTIIAFADNQKFKEKTFTKKIPRQYL